MALKKYLFQKFKNTPLTNFAIDVEKITLQKRNNLILNIDGFIAVSIIDIFQNNDLFSQTDIEELLDLDLLNGFFLLARTIGLCGHWIDQKRLNQPLYRCDEKDIKYL